MPDASDKRQRVLVLYGGDAATNPRHELLAWLRGPAMNIDARVVADEAPHSDGAVDDRVDVCMDWAQKAIAIITPAPRSQHGAPNVMDEIRTLAREEGKADVVHRSPRGRAGLLEPRRDRLRRLQGAS